MKNLLLFFSHVLNLILVFITGLIFGAALVLVDPDGTISEGVDLVCKSYKDKKKGAKTDKTRKMGFHLIED